MLDFIKRILIVDDQEDEVQILKQAFEHRSIFSIYINPLGFDFEECKNLPPIQLVFMDFKLANADNNDQADLSIIRSMLDLIPQNTAYGLVLWTSHSEKLLKLREAINKDSKSDENKYPKPSFIIGMAKQELLKDSFNEKNFFKALEDRINEDKAAQFFIAWMNDTNTITNKTILELFKLASDYLNQSEQFIDLIKTIALSQFDSDLKMFSDDEKNIMYTREALHSVDKLLYSNLRTLHYSKGIPDFYAIDFSSSAVNPSVDAKNIRRIASINTAFYIDASPEDAMLAERMILPGTVYKYEHGSQNILKKQIPDDAMQIAVEITPPCDFAQNKKVLSRLICGYIIFIKSIKDSAITENSNGNKKAIKKKKSEIQKLYNDYRGDYIFITGPFSKTLINEENAAQDDCDCCMMVLNLNHLISIDDKDLISANKFQFLFRLKNDLFADLLQKFSSHASRLGNSVIHIS